MSRSSRVRAVGSVVLAVAVAFGAVGCSSDGEAPTTTKRGPISFGEAPPEATRLGLCKVYGDDQIKQVLGEEGYRKLAPAAIGEKGDKVTGERCEWQRAGGGDAVVSLKVEVQDYGADLPALAAKYDELKGQTISAADLGGIGEAAFSSESDETSLLQVRSGPYLLTLSTRATGEDMEPVPVETLKFLAGAAIAKLP